MVWSGIGIPLSQGSMPETLIAPDRLREVLPNFIGGIISLLVEGNDELSSKRIRSLDLLADCSLSVEVTGRQVTLPLDQENLYLLNGGNLLVLASDSGEGYVLLMKRGHVPSLAAALSSLFSR